MKTKNLFAGLFTLGAIGAGAYGVYLMSKENGGETGFVPQDLGGTDKARAQRWLAARTKYNQHMDKPRAEVMDNSLAMDTGKAQELAKVIKRMRGDSVTYEKVSPWGVGRPEEY